MKKIFTLISGLMLAFSASADVWVVPSEAPAAGSVIVDNDLIKASTVYATKIADDKVTLGGQEFGYRMQVRVAAWPSADDLNGTDNGGSTPVVIEVKKAINITFAFRRQSKDGYAAGDGKDIAVFSHPDAKKLTGEMVEANDLDGSYGNCLEKFSLPVGTYTVAAKGTTLGLFGFIYEANGTQPTEPSEPTEPTEPTVPSTEALMSWDFTKWSDATVANLKAGSNWSDIEKADKTEPTEKSKDNCFWQVSAKEGLNADKYLMANDVVIEELKGLVYTNEANRSLAIAVNYPDPDPSSDFGPYHGSAYLWLGSKNLDYFIIPGVPAGATIKMGVESHKISDARGVKLSVAGETLNAPDGSAVAAPKTYTEQEWLVPATAAASNNVQITNTNGCHIYFITVTAAGSSAIETIEIDENAPVEYYNLQGMRVDNPTHGIYIKRQGSSVKKVIIK